MSFFGIPLDSKDVVISMLRAVREFVSQTMAGCFERCAGSFVGRFESFASHFINLVPRIFNNHGLSPESLPREMLDAAWIRLRWSDHGMKLRVPIAQTCS